MTALTADRRSTWRNGVDFDDPVASDAVIYAGALVVLDADGNRRTGHIGYWPDSARYRQSGAR